MFKQHWVTGYGSLKAYTVDTNLEDFWATQAGFEYSFIGVFESNLDLGLLMEHSWDSRGEVASWCARLINAK